MESRRSKRIKLQNERREQKEEEDDANYELRVTEEHQIIHSVGPPMICWEQGTITTHLEQEDPDGLEHLINSSPYFRELLKDKRTLILSKKVFKIFSTWLYARHEDKILPKFLALREHMFNCRLVCKSWCSSFDNMVQHQLLNGVFIMTYPRRLCLHHSAKITATNFLKDFEKTHPPPSMLRSPLVTRRLEFCADWFTRQPAENWNQLFSVLQNYGDHIWHLSLTFDCKEAYSCLTPQQTYLKFRETLMLTPNLKTLYISQNGFTENRLSTFQSLIRSNPLPKLLSLKNLNIQAVPNLVFSHILRQNDHVPRLELDFKDEYDYNVELGNLTVLKVKVLTRDFRNFVSSTWRVKTLNLDFWKAEFTWNQQILNLISDNWGQNSEQLVLSLPSNHPGRTTLRNCANCRLNLPNAKILCLNMNGNAISIDVFLEMKTLEKITINREKKFLPEFQMFNEVIELGERNRVRSKIIQFNGYEKKMYQSNIWNLFPKLKYFEVDGNKYSRAEWIQVYKKKSRV